MHIVLRTKGNHKQGMGDVIGSIAIAQVLIDKAEILFVVDNDKEAVESIMQQGFIIKAVNNIEEELESLDSFKPDAIIVNQLNSHKDFLEKLKQRTGVLVTIDDVGPGSSIADLQFNSLYYRPGSYSGPEFIPLRKEFQDINRKKKTICKEVKKLLITMGGSDTCGFTPEIVHALSCLSSEVEINIIIGSAFQHEDQLNDVMRDMNRQFAVLRNIDDIANVMFYSDIAICSGGITLFELACVGTPAVVICGEPFEEETAARMQENGFGINLGFGKYVEDCAIFQAVDSLIHNYDLRFKISENGKKRVDGMGAKRIVEVILKKMNFHE